MVFLKSCSDKHWRQKQLLNTEVNLLHTAVLWMNRTAAGNNRLNYRQLSWRTSTYSYHQYQQLVVSGRQKNIWRQRATFPGWGQWSGFPSVLSHCDFESRFYIPVSWPPYVTGQAIVFSCCCFYLSFFSSPNLSGRTLDVYHTSTHGVALVRI